MPNCNPCNTLSGTAAEQWEQYYGTTAAGNLPQYKVLQHKGHSWQPCPYSTQADNLRSEYMLGIVPAKVDHIDANGKLYYMRTASRGEWGYECTYDQCPYYLVNGKRYFYV